MRLLIQCVKEASVAIDGKVVSSIGRGDLVFVGFTQGDNAEIVDKMIAKLLKLRIFPDEKGMTNLSLGQVGGEMLAVSQFTLYASLKDGNRPAFANCMPAEDARKIYGYFTEALTAACPDAKYGVFQADMKVRLLNDGPFTILLDSKELGYGIKVLLGLSGGVDSAVSGYFLKKQGYEVTGCFMRNWDSIANNDIKGNPTLSGSKCSQELDYDDAVKTAQELGIPLLREDFIKEYWDDVFSYFLEEYKEGRTPNPDVFCNKYIKFEAFRKFAFAQGFQMIAMGHYAKRVDQDGFAMLYKAFDKNKDQSYFLSEINEDQLKDTLFPLGDITKPEVRKIAEEQHLSIAHKKDSTGVCFIGERRFKEFLENYLPAHEGKIVDIVSGKTVGRHDGVLYYTVGQHRGLSIGGIPGFKDEPWFVVGKDVKQNILYVGQEENPFMYSYRCALKKVNLIMKEKPQKPLDICAKFRYRGKDMPVRFTYISDNEAYLDYPGYKYIAKGQIAVLYDGERCLGGGIIIDTYDKQGKKISY